MKLPRWALVATALILAARAVAAPVDSRITDVTVYADRAVVTRTASVELPGGHTELVFTNLPESLLDQSLQVNGRGTAAATILDVSARRTFVDFTPNERLQALEDQLRTLRAEERSVNDEQAVLASQRETITKFLHGAVAPGGKDVDRPKLDDVRAVLEFGQKQLLDLATAGQKLEVRLEDLGRKIAAVEQQMNELRGGGRGRAFKTVTVRVSAEQAGRLDVTLAYTVGGARWFPSYDARVQSAARAVALGYFGVVRQNTGEDWKDVNLTLSTARPALGGAAPELSAWELQVWEPVAVAYERADRAGRARMQSMAPAAVAMADSAPPPPDEREAKAAEAILEAGLTSASFKLATTATIPSDGSAQKVPITSAQLAALPEYATTPKLQTTAFLTTKVTNSTEFPLLAGAMNVFLDGTFVATSQLKTVMAGEKFDLSLGADEGISVKHKRLQRFVENTGLTNSGTRTTYEYLITIQNNKRTAEKIVVTDQVPLSRHEKIIVKQLAPDAREVKPDNQGLLKWTLDLRPGEKRELTVKFSVEHPNDLNVSGVE